MVSIEKKGDNFIFEVKGLHKLWAFQSQLKIPAAHIKSAYINKEDLNWTRSLRMPGLSIPGVITAGTFLVKDGTLFCDITDDKNCLIVELHDELYTKLIIEVEDPQQALALLTAK